MLDATLSAVRASAKPLSVLFKYYTYTEYPAPTIFISPQHQESSPHVMQDNVLKSLFEAASTARFAYREQSQFSMEQHLAK